MAVRKIRVAVLLSVLTALNGASFAAQQGNAPPQKSTSREAAQVETILVCPFENASRMVKLEWLGEGLAELTRERLSGEGRVLYSREERLAALEKMGLPSSTHFSRATMLKIGAEMDADAVVFGQFTADGGTITLTARVLRLDPPGLSPPLVESGALEDLMDAHSRLAWRVVTAIEPGYGFSRAEFTARLPRVRLDAFEYYVRGLLNTENDKGEQRLRMFREAARLAPNWVAPAFAVGQAYFARRDCDDALLWLSRVPPAHERGAEATFDAGVCHLLRNDAARAEAAFASLSGGATHGTGSGTSGVQGPESPEVLSNLALALAREGKAREAAALLERATVLEPEDADYWFNLGLARLMESDAARAAAAFRECLRRKPESNDARTLLAAGTASPAKESLARMGKIKMRLEAPPMRHPAASPAPAQARQPAPSGSVRSSLPTADSGSGERP